MSFSSPYPLIREASTAFRPPRRLSVAAGAEQVLTINQAGGYSGKWSPDEAPYMIEPMNTLASREHEALCFVGPARSGKTMGLLDGWFSHVVVNDPGDMLIVQMTQNKAREYAKTRINKAIYNSDPLRELLSTHGHDDNTHDKMFKNGMWLKIAWPSESQLSSSDYRYVAWTDYDRASDDIDGAGSGFQLGLKRIQTYLSRGMAVFESSPGRDYDDPYWVPEFPHEAPPASGIVGIYNLSDRRRLYWQCMDCHEYFEATPGLDLFATLPDELELLELVRKDDLTALAEKHAFISCRHCGSEIQQKHKPALNNYKTLRWLGENQSINADGEIFGEKIKSNVAGFFLGGVAAAYQKWDNLILRYLQGLREFALTGSDKTLKATINTDQGLPYLPMHLKDDKAQNAEDRADARLKRFTVPDWARFLIGTVDIQGGVESRFVCEVRAYGVDLESCVVDRFDIALTERGGLSSRVDPSAYIEDWDLLTDKMVNATYQTSGERELRVYRVGVDTGGESGVTPNAYNWQKRLRAVGLSDRVYLIKGGNHQQEKPIVRSYARNTKGKREKNTPIWLVATNYFKDIVTACMRRDVPGPGYFHPSKWLPQSYFNELRSETRDKLGRWTKKGRGNNESFDLWCYSLAIVHALGFGPSGKLDWTNPPDWALPMDDNNSQLIAKEERQIRKVLKKTKPLQSQRPALGRGGWAGRL